MDKKTIAFIAAMLLITAGVLLFVETYVLVDDQLYERHAETLDLRGTGITVEHYDNICKKMPQCDVLWDVPFQDTYYAEDTQSLTVTTLSDEDVVRLDYMTELETVHAEECLDYPQLEALRLRRPEVDVIYTVSLNGDTYFQDTTQLTLTGIAQEEVALLQYLPELESVTLIASEDAQSLLQLQETCREMEIDFSVVIQGEHYRESQKTLEVTGITAEEVKLLQYLPNLKSVHFINPEAPVESLLQLREDRPEVNVTWEQDVAGMMFSDDVTEVDISGILIEDLQSLVEPMTYLPNAEKLIMCDCGVDNDTMAAFRDECRENFKVVWSVKCGVLTVRTDDICFAPVKYGLSVSNLGAQNLRYCEDMICIDVGHFKVSNIDWVAYMPHLKYLILAHTMIYDITPISNCKELEFLELDHTSLRDYTPLLECTGLRDLNLGRTKGDWRIIAQMTWLENLWWMNCPGSRTGLREALPNTTIKFDVAYTVAGGWRQLQNYYNMRDIMEMPYLS